MVSINLPAHLAFACQRAQQSLRTLSLALLTCALVACGGGQPNTRPTGSSSLAVAGAPYEEPAHGVVLRDSSSGFVCAPEAITCVEVVTDDNALSADASVTFGQPFRAGDLRANESVEARLSDGTSVPVQIDATAHRDDGSLRFAVVSLKLPAAAPGSRRVVHLFRARQIETASEASAARYELNLDLKLYQPQMSRLTFGNPQGWNDGLPFRLGDVVTLRIGEEEHAVTITEAMAGGSLNHTERVATAFMERINNLSSRFKAHKIGDAGAWNHLWVSTRDADGGSFSIGAHNPNGSAPIDVWTPVSYAPARRFTAAAGPALRQGIQTGLKAHYRGPVQHEYTLTLPLQASDAAQVHPHLTARLHVRLLDGGDRARTDLVIENTRAYTGSPGNFLYDLKATHQGQTLLTQDKVNHTHHARWHQVVWQGPPDRVSVRHHMPYFMASKVTWHYSTRLQVPERLLEAEASRLAIANTRPMGNAFLTPYFGTTGARQEIGPYPRWTALYLVSQDARAKASMLANADAAASVPVHYRDEATGQPLDLDTRPSAATWFAYNSGEPADRFPVMTDTGTAWTPDISHQGSFAFVPYLITGDVFYLEELQFWASWNMAAIAPGYRQGANGLINDQIRGQAWGLRALGEAARITPTSHPLKAYFKSRLEKNIDWHLQKTVLASDVSPLGLIEKPDARGVSGLWQNDFFSLVVAQLVEDGSPRLLPVLNWINRFNVGRFTHEAEGYCLYSAARDYLTIRNASDQWFSTWSALFNANFSTVNCPSGVDPNSYPDSPSAHAAIARAMLAASFNAQLSTSQNGAEILEAAAGYRNWTARTPLITERMATDDPTWAIVPRVPP